MPSVDTRNDRLQIRLDAAAKRLLQKAARYTHKSVSQFVLTHSLDAAERVVEEREAVSLSERDWELFLDALDNPPAPSARLKRAARRHSERHG